MRVDDEAQAQEIRDRGDPVKRDQVQGDPVRDHETVTMTVSDVVMVPIHSVILMIKQYAINWRTVKTVNGNRARFVLISIFPKM